MTDNQIVIYQTADGKTAIDVKLEADTVWLSLNQLAALFERDKSVVSRHLKNIFREEELDRHGQLLHFLQQLPVTVKGTKWNIIILMQ